MARVGGRNTFFAWLVGLVCAGVVVGLGVLALPLLPATVDWAGDQLRGPAPEAETVGEGGSVGDPVECRDLYVEALWSVLVWAPDSLLDQSTEPPTTTAAPVVGALSPTVRMTCDWRSESGTISTTLATVATDAGAIATSALPSLGFTCTETETRVRCVREDRGEESTVTETIETGGGLWLSTSQTDWYPADYHRRLADRVWVDES